MADKKKKTLKSYTTAAGSQQAGSDADIKKLVVRLNKDVDKVLDGSMTHAEFKKKYGKSVVQTQKMIYSASAASGSKREKENVKTGVLKNKEVYSYAARILDDYEKRQKKETKKLKAKEKTDRKFTPQDNRKGGMTLSTVDNRKKK